MNRVKDKDVKDWNAKYQWHPFADPNATASDKPVIIESGRDVFVYDVDGKEYIDGQAVYGTSTWVTAGAR
jgi:adenosylmethionine-8-amino-7-oxononanoate aminotransferase